MGSNKYQITLLLPLSLIIILFLSSTSAQLRQNFYANICPDVENIVRRAVKTKFDQTFVTVPATIRLLFHDCMVSGCDASVIVASTPGNTAEKDHPDNLSLAGDGFDTVIKAKAAVDAVAGCTNRVSCADILVMAARDVIALAGGPSYPVELGRFDGLTSTAASVEGNLPQPTFNLNQLNAMFASRGLSQTDMIALSGNFSFEFSNKRVKKCKCCFIYHMMENGAACHTVGFSHCSKFANRIYNFSSSNPVDPTLDRQYATQLQNMCPRDVDPQIAIDMDPTTPRQFDNAYFRNLQNGKGLFTSDQSLFTDSRSKPTVNLWASNSQIFNQAFIEAMTKLGRVGVKTRLNGNIRVDCGKFN
ncbi:peroxidase 73 [Dorcoceras hygrometricum]|uniref:Peroxidase n=1 Tax=Dorcoceras hygrometricum TaxID=472368 RepID=A0A2Z7D1B2_9LAMI|nr:peroxidase 73 [Dorcoceras hygrometricum]